LTVRVFITVFLSRIVVA